VRARLQSDTRAEHRRDETTAGGGEDVIPVLARAVAVCRARERVPTCVRTSSGRLTVKFAKIDRVAVA
jgi:hypothetical protein